MTTAIFQVIAASPGYVEDFVPTVDVFSFPERIILFAFLISLVVFFFQYRKNIPFLRYLYRIIFCVALLYFLVVLWISV